MLKSINPATQTCVGEVKISTESEIKQKVQAAQMAKRKWKDLGIEKRCQILRPIVDIFQNQIEEIAQLTTAEMGKPISEAREDIQGDFIYLNAFFTDGPLYLADEITVREATQEHHIVYEPRGVAACIAPWNFPFTNFLWAVFPNLIAGNTVVFKHSEECPLMGKLMESCMQQLSELPAGVFSAVHGDRLIGEILLQQEIDLIWFTGSSQTGQKIFELAGRKHIKSILEMGGSNPALVFEDVNIEEVASKIYANRFFNAGQVCDAIKRVLVHRSRFDELIDKLQMRIQQAVLGDPTLAATQIGPLCAMRQVQLLEDQIQSALKAGAVAVTGGKRPQVLSGAYYEPTLLMDVKPSMRVWCEETFGPVLPIMPFDSQEEAIHLANDSIYGLGSVVYSADLVRARQVASALDAGFVDINAGNHWRSCNPFGGYKASGKGCEHGRWGFQELCQVKVVAEG